MLRKTVKELGFHSFIYLLGSIASAIASIILLPVYTRFLSRADYGILEIIDSARSLLIIILLAGFVPATAKFYKETDSEDTRKAIIGTALWFIFCSSLIWAIGLFFFNDFLARELLGGIKLVSYINLGIVLLFIQVIFTTDQNYLNMQKKSKFFLAISVSKLCINIGANLYFIVILRLGAKGMLYGELLSTGVVGTFLTAYVIKKNGLPFRFDLFGRLLKFGSPFILNSFSSALTHRADRYLIQKFTSLSDVGIYGLGYRFPDMMNFLLLASFGRIWYASSMYDIAKQQDYQRNIAKVATYVITVYALCQYMLIVMSPTVLRVLAAPEYFEAWKVFQVVGLGFCFYSIHPFFTMGAFIKNKTWYLPISHLLPAFINITLNWYFLPRFGYMAAAWNSVISYFAYSFLNFLLFRKVYPIRFEFRRLGFLFGAGIILVLLSNVFFLHNSILEFVKEVGFSVVLPLILLFGPYLDRDEKETLYEELQKIHPKLAIAYSRVVLK